jgi:hypothetical protein
MTNKRCMELLHENAAEGGLDVELVECFCAMQEEANPGRAVVLAGAR